MALWRKIVIAVLIVGAILTGWTAWERKAAWQVYRRGSAPVAPTVSSSVEERLQSEVLRLQTRFPQLRSVEPRYLAQPLEDTQAILLTLAQNAFQHRQHEDWALVLRVLGQMELRARWERIPDLALVRGLEQRLRALNGQARVLARWAPVRVDSPAPEWTSDQAILERILQEKRERLWDHARVDGLHPVALVVGFGNWKRVRRQFQQLDKWAAQARRGEPLTAPEPGLELEKFWDRLK